MMKCPKCHFEQNENLTSCPKCGIYFEKYSKYHNEEKAPSSAKITYQKSWMEKLLQYDWGGLLFFVDDKTEPLFFYSRLIVYVGLFVWGWIFIFSSIESNYAGESFMHLINLPFHEAGHIIFSPFGSFIASLGGTLGQMLIPLICLWTFLFKYHNTFGAFVAFWWFGQNFFDIAPYINDARAGVLPLLGGNFGHSSPYGFHDWEYLLTESGLIQYDHVIAKLSVIVGTIIFLLAFAWGAKLLLKQKNNL